jgi:hypothetical protein
MTSHRDGIRDVVVDSEYHHDDHGRVTVRRDGAEVWFAIHDEHILAAGERLRRVVRQDRAAFVRSTTPAPVTIETPPATAGVTLFDTHVNPESQ